MSSFARPIKCRIQIFKLPRRSQHRHSGAMRSIEPQLRIGESRDSGSALRASRNDADKFIFQNSSQPSLRANGSRECAPDDRLREANHPVTRRKNGLLRFACNDVRTHLRLPAARDARVVQNPSPRKNQRAQGKPGARCTRSLVRKV
jgi:hypothetical protein